MFLLYFAFREVFLSLSELELRATTLSLFIFYLCRSFTTAQLQQIMGASAHTVRKHLILSGLPTLVLLIFACFSLSTSAESGVERSSSSLYGILAQVIGTGNFQVRNCRADSFNLCAHRTHLQSIKQTKPSTELLGAH